MATVNATTLTRAPRAERSYAYTDQASITATPATGDIWRFFVIPAGTEIHELTITNATLGTAAPVDLGFAPTDGSATTQAAFASAYAAGTATSAGAVYHITLASPVRVEKDSYLQGVFGTINTGASGAMTVAAKGLLLGDK